MNTLHLSSPNLESTIQIGRLLGKCLPRGAFVALEGVLGAGKTQFVKGIACGLDEGGWAGLRSPTFTLMLSYHGGRAVLHHIDFYRLNESPELPGEILEAINSDRAIAVVEWADIWREVWPKNYIHVRFDVEDDTSKRRVTIEDPTGLCPDLVKQLDDYIVEPAGT
ncbi:MAG: tRNA (adenosine(37)-N6)-threonylcarbamoyltransferase complex ATPase subunit type 1 TsaE [Planctomycetes bacterium]|nr:tRNA (adenosine(37)-N6)-threonylcarbamoyltransferase complex ATPase subunit type 1 TsaE [Planctomycetota bacterium]